jgi:hypothetical protein
MEFQRPLIIKAFWDEEASVWVASSEDVPGLATEAESMNRLVEKLKVMIPELLDANGYADGDDAVPFELLSQLSSVAYRHAA